MAKGLLVRGLWAWGLEPVCLGLVVDLEPVVDLGLVGLRLAVVLEPVGMGPVDMLVCWPVGLGPVDHEPVGLGSRA